MEIGIELLASPRCKGSSRTNTQLEASRDDESVGEHTGSDTAAFEKREKALGKSWADKLPSWYQPRTSCVGFMEIVLAVLPLKEDGRKDRLHGTAGYRPERARARGGSLE